MGVILANYQNNFISMSRKENNFDRIAVEIDHSSQFRVEQKWASLGEIELSPLNRRITDFINSEQIPKFQLINKLLTNANVSGFWTRKAELPVIVKP